MQKIATCLWFDDQAEEAANFYISIFKNSKILDITRYGEAGPGPQGAVMTVVFQIEGQEFIGLNGGPHFTFTPAISLSVDCHSQDEVDTLWAKLLSGEITPSPIFINGLFIAASPSDRLFALRPDGAGDVTKSHLAWESDENVPDVTSPASNGDLVFTVLSHGVVTCHDFKDGKKLWEHELGFDVNASPAIAGDRVYLFGTKGTVAVVEAGRAAKELARFELGEGVFASPAMAQGVMVVRTAKSLFCVGPENTPRLEAKQP